MIKPLALISYEDLLPGSQLVNRLQDLGYRVRVLNDPAQLPALAAEELPLVILVHLASERSDLFSIIRTIKSAGQTSHIPILAFGLPRDRAFKKAAAAGASLVALDDAVAAQLPHLLEQVLELH